MIKRLVYNKKAFKILNGFTIKQSNAEVTFNDITIDFTGYSLLDIPFKYQELKIIQAETEEDILNENGEVVFAGFLDDIDLSEMKIRKEEQRELTLTVLSPLAMSTKRYVSLIGTYSKEEAIRRVLQPLLDDGFKIVEFNIPTGQITTNFVIESVENCMNDMCFKAGVFWFIDENKNIYINSIDYLFGLGSKKTIAPDVITKGLSKIQPKIENIDYANVINFKNVRIYYSTMSMCDELNNLIEEHDYPLLNLPKKLKKGDTVQFNNPIVVSEDTLRKLREEGEVDDADVASLSIVIGGEEFYIRIETNEKSADYDKYVTSNNFSFSDDGGEEKTLVLQRDSFFNNLITGFKWNGADNSVVSRIYTGTALRYTTMRFMHSAEINNLKGVISDTGIVEKCIDYQEKWTTTTQLVDYARSLMSSNTKTINQVDLTFDETPNLKIGDIVEIHEPDFYIDGKFAVKEISYKYINDENEEWNIKLKNSDLNSTYIDLFRPAQKQENESKTDTVVLSEYVEETVYEKHEIGEKETLTGEVIVVKDNDGLITIEKINGSHSQKTTEGRNVFNPKITTRTNQGVTVSQEGKYRVKINGKATGSQKIEFDTIPNFEQGKYYTVTIKKISGSCTKASANATWGFLFYPESSAGRNVIWLPNDTVKTATFQAIGSGTKPYFWQGWDTTSVVGTNSVFNNLILEISIVEGTTAKEYEDYTGGKPSPSPDYPQEIETVGSNVNLLDFNVAQDKKVTVNDDGTITINGSGGFDIKFKEVVYKKGITYKIKATLVSGTYNGLDPRHVGIMTPYGDNEWLANNIFRTYTFLEDKVSSGMWTDAACVFNNATFKIYSYEGTEEAPYSPYGQGSVGIDVANKNLLNIANTEETTKGGITYSIKNRIFKLNGTATANFDIQLSKNVEIKKGKYTHSSSYIQSGLYVSFDNLGYTMLSAQVGKKRTFEITEDTTYKTYFIWIDKGTVLNNVEIKLQLEVGDTATDFVEHREEKYLLPIQQEMLEGDYIDSTEHHTWEKLVLDGSEDWGASSSPNQVSTTYFSSNFDVAKSNSNYSISNYFSYAPDLWNKDKEGIYIDFLHGHDVRIRISKEKASTIAEFKSWLKSKYDEGNPVIIYYKLATPIELELTDAQKAISKYLQPYDNGTTILVTDKLATITASYTKKGENDEN
jgi:hypothetical protein